MILQDTQIPYLNDESFQYQLDYSFRIKPKPENPNVDVYINTPQYSAIPLAFITMNIRLFNKNKNFYRYKISSEDSGGKIFAKKIKSDTTNIVLNIGFVSDIKDGKSSGKYRILLYDYNKNAIQKLDIEVNEIGEFIINNRKRGKI